MEKAIEERLAVLSQKIREKKMDIATIDIPCSICGFKPCRCGVFVE
jgi:hypothetical protein